MIRFFRTRAPLFALLLLVALLITLPGIRHPLPMIGLAVFTIVAWRALSRWRATPVEPRSLDEDVARAADDWDQRHLPPDSVAEAADEPWRASLRPSDGWRGTDEEEI